MKREINFRTGKGRLSEAKKALSPKALIAAMRFVGMSDEQIKEALRKASQATPTEKGDIQ